MEEVPIVSSDEERRLVKQMMAYDGTPAYARRAQVMEEAFARLLERCRQQRDELLAMVRLRLGVLRAMAGDWERLRPLLGDEHLEALRKLHAELVPQLRVAVAVTSSTRALRRALRELRESVGGFNRRWRAVLAEVSLGHVNELREGYNRYYVIEKECALRSPHLARQGFVCMEPATVADLVALLPPLPLFPAPA
jgi:hypothetical protein